MFKTVMWIAAACAAILLALAVSRSLKFDRPAKAPEPPSAAAADAAPPVETAPAPPPEVKEAPPPPPTPEEQQIQDDAAATGMTTMEPETSPSEPPTN